MDTYGLTSAYGSYHLARRILALRLRDPTGRLLPNSLISPTMSTTGSATMTTWRTLLLNFEKFLKVCLNNNITLNVHKTRFGFSSAQFFGFEVDAAGIRLAEKHLNPLENLVPPTDISELRRVLGLFQVSRRFIDHYAHVALPMSSLLRGRKPAFTGGQNNKLRLIPSETPFWKVCIWLRLATICRFTLATDASDDGKGGVLYQLPGVPIDQQYPHDPACMLLTKWPSFLSTQSAGLKLYEDARLSIWKLTPYCGEWRRQGFTPCHLLSPFTRTLITLR